MINRDLKVTPSLTPQELERSRKRELRPERVEENQETRVLEPRSESDELREQRELSDQEIQGGKLEHSLKHMSTEIIDENALELHDMLDDIMEPNPELLEAKNTIQKNLNKLSFGRDQLQALDKIIENTSSSETEIEAAKEIKSELLQKIVSQDFSLTDVKKLDQFIKDFQKGTANFFGTTHNKDMIKVNDALKELQKLVKADPNDTHPENVLKKQAALNMLKETCSNFLINDQLAQEGQGKTKSTKYDQVEALMKTLRQMSIPHTQTARTLKGISDTLQDLTQPALALLPKETAKHLNPQQATERLAQHLMRLAPTLDSSAYQRLESAFTQLSTDLQNAVQNGDLDTIKLTLLNLEAQSFQAELTSVNANNLPIKPKAKVALENSVTDSMARLGEETLGQFFASKPEANTDELKTAALKDLLVNTYKNDFVPLKVTSIYVYIRQLETPDPILQKALDQSTQELNQYAQEQMANIGPSLSERTSYRVPSEVTVDWMAALTKASEASENETLTTLLNSAKSHFMKHDMTVEKTTIFLVEAASIAKEAGLDELSDLAQTLISQLPKDNESVSLYRLQDNIYGRVFDSNVVNEMVKNPPESVKTAMTQTKTAVLAYINDPKNFLSKTDQENLSLEEQTEKAKKNLEKCVEGLQEYMSTKDPRFWFPKVPGLEAIRDAPTPEEAVEAFKTYLSSPVNDGNDSVSVPWVMCKFFITAGQKGFNPEWKERGDQNYGEVHQKVVGRTNLPGPKANPQDQETPRVFGVSHVSDKHSGITLKHQPGISEVDETLALSTRPTTYNMPQIAVGDVPTEVVKHALDNGLPFASGVSGSTNIMLHLFEYIKTEVDPSIDSRDFLIGTMNFLVHDGGHSIHEVMWTANQLDQRMGLGLNFGDSDDTTHFTADYRKLISMYDREPANGTSKSDMEQIISKAFQNTTSYFNEHSYYSKEK